jgi:non-ribosomal peptide synthetase component E (peptide arylation enzyme)
MYGTVAWPLIRTAQLRPDQQAVIDGDIRRTYGDVHDRLSRLGAGLDRRGIERGQVVSVPLTIRRRISKRGSGCRRIGD